MQQLEVSNAYVERCILDNIDEINDMDNRRYQVTVLDTFKFDTTNGDSKKDKDDIRLLETKIDKIVSSVVQSLRKTGYIESYLNAMNLVGMSRGSAVERVIEMLTNMILGCIETLCNPFIHPPWRCYIIRKAATLLFWYIPFNVDETVVVAWRR